MTKISSVLLRSRDLGVEEQIKLVFSEYGVKATAKDVELVSVLRASLVNKELRYSFKQAKSLADLELLLVRNQTELLLDDYTERVTELKARYDVENDPRYKQLISYVVLESPKYVLGYKRLEGGGEGRLKGKVAIGVGGHVNDLVQDIYGISDDLGDNALRELHEELAGLPSDLSKDDLDFVGFINSNVDSVGKVHLGLVYRYNVSDELMESLASGEEDTLALMLLEKGKGLELPVGLIFEDWSDILVRELFANAK